MIEVSWEKDYKGEFICPYCHKYGLKLNGLKKSQDKRIFKCHSCQKNITSSHNIRVVEFVDNKTSTIWYKGYRIDGFVCPSPDCNGRDIFFDSLTRDKKRFKCRACGKLTVESFEINQRNLNRLAQKSLSVIPFDFQNDRWDLRAIITSCDNNNNRFMANFEDLQPDWFKFWVKKYIYHLCKLDKPFNTISTHLSSFRSFSYYINKINIVDISEINRGIILDFITLEKTQTGDEGIRHRLSTLRDFFFIGNAQGWFQINDQDIIRWGDSPKARRKNPDPIQDNVREQIEKNLHKLPDPIARMWIIAFFTAMRPIELAFLKKDCLVQEGGHWKIVWNRKKGKDQHEVPVTRIIAKIVNEQVEYIEQLWGNEWEYLFCHYQGFSKADPNHSKLQPVKKVIPASDTPLQIAIRCLIKTLDLRDENGELATFSPNLVRPTRLTQLFEQGHDLAVVSAWAGHKNLETTSTYYTYVSCDLIEKETLAIQKALFNVEGKPLHYESLPKSFWSNPSVHQLELTGDHINTPIYGYCALPLDQRCDKFRACYTCSCFAATPEKISLYIKTRDELRAKESRAASNGHDVLVEQFGRQADQLDKIIAGLQGGNHS